MYDFKKILIVRFSSLGDILLTTPLLRVLRKAYPEARIDFLVKSAYADILKFNPHLTSIIELNTTEREELRGVREIIGRTKYDLLLDLHHSLRSRYVRWGSGAREVRTINKREIRRFALVHLKRNFYRDIVPVAERYLETVKPFGVMNDGLGLEVFIPEDNQRTVHAMMAQGHGTPAERTVGLAPWARHFTKRWPQERFVELGIEIAKRHKARLIVFGGKEEKDYCADIAQMINARGGASAAESFAGKLTLLETAAAFDCCHVIVTNDTGLMHLAAARRRRVVAIFGSTVQEFGFFPYGTESSIVEKRGLACRPCTANGRAECPEGHFRCMKEIEPEEVIRAIDAFDDGARND